MTRSFDVFFDLRLNKRLSKQSRRWWFERPPRSLWRYCNGKVNLWQAMWRHFCATIGAILGLYLHRRVSLKCPIDDKPLLFLGLETCHEENCLQSSSSMHIYVNGRETLEAICELSCKLATIRWGASIIYYGDLTMYVKLCVNELEKWWKKLFVFFYAHLIKPQKEVKALSFYDRF